MVNLVTSLAGIELKNPILTASGTFGYGTEFTDFIDLNKLGGLIVKGTTLSPREGNAPPRMAETPSGMLNAVGLQNKGVDYLIKEYLPKLKKYKTPVFVNVSGSDQEEYLKTVEKLLPTDIAGIELNISCPNVKKGGMMFGTDPNRTAELVSAVKKICTKPLIVKLSPNVTDITEIALAAEAAGADALSLINTVLGMAIDIEKKRPILSTITGGLSGPAIKPIALRMVWQVYQKVKIPIIGIGGISSWQDAVEFFLAGASAVEIGTANFINPQVTINILDGLNNYFKANKITELKKLIGALETK